MQGDGKSRRRGRNGDSVGPSGAPAGPGFARAGRTAARRHPAGWAGAAGRAGVGLALSIGTIAAIASQLPAGALVDAVPAKRAITGRALGLTGISALLLAARPRPGSGFVAQIWSAQVLHAVAASALTPAIAALGAAGAVAWAVILLAMPETRPVQAARPGALPLDPAKG